MIKKTNRTYELIKKMNPRAAAYVLTNGLLGLPAMGAAGIGWATTLMFWMQALGFALYLWRSPRFADLQLFAHFEWPRWPAQRELLLNGQPVNAQFRLTLNFRLQ